MEAGFKILVATSGKDGLSLCKQGRADIVLVEALQPGLDGVDFCRALKGDDALAHLPVGVITHEEDCRQRFRALAAGADECFSLPLVDASFIMRMRSLVGLWDLTASLRRMHAMSGDVTMEIDPAPVLVLDPDERSRRRLEDILSLEFPVVSAGDAENAVSAMASSAFGIVLCDFAGIAQQEPIGSLLIQQLRLVSLTGKLHLIGIGNEPGDVVQEAGTGEVDDVLLRPLDRSEALLRVRIAARKHGTRAQLKILEAGLAAIGGLSPAEQLPLLGRLAA
jgi:two-component system cell cycle response regulator